MKRILTFAAILLIGQSMLFAQSGISVSEQEVPERFVKDFNRLSDGAKDVDWRYIDTLVYDAYFTNESGTFTAYRFSPKGTETRWYVEDKYYPHSIVDFVADQYPGYKIKELYILMIKNKATYQVLIGKKKGFFVTKWRHLKLLNFETDGKFIDAIEY
ncbi:MAG: hypothetical protein J6Y98_08010 [Bacteroidales bacterium]|nr:hypothetical protein [Bacteroidales bacterium]